MSVRILIGDCRKRLSELPDRSAHCCVTSPPYFGLRDYGVNGQIGLEQTPEQFVAELVSVFREVHRVLRDDATLWLNLGDSYANDGKWGGASGGKHAKELHGNSSIGRRKKITGLKPKDLIGIPWRVAFALQADGWFLRQDIVWSKPNPMPESVTDRCTKSHEYLFMLSKSQRYFYDQDAIKEPGVSHWSTDDQKMPDGWDTGAGAHGAFHRQGREKGKRTDKQRGHSRRHAGFNERWDAMDRKEQCGGMRNKRSVWTVATAPFSDAHFATYSPALIEPCVLAGSPKGGLIIDPFFGAGTTGLVSDRLGRDCIGIELNPEYAEIARRRIVSDATLLSQVTVNEGMKAA